MRLGLLALLPAPSRRGVPARAQNYPWCANFADGAGVNCGFSTYQQCMTTSQGSGGYCTKNDRYAPPHAGTAGATPAHRVARKHRRAASP